MAINSIGDFRNAIERALKLSVAVRVFLGQLGNLLLRSGRVAVQREMALRCEGQHPDGRRVDFQARAAADSCLPQCQTA